MSVMTIELTEWELEVLVRALSEEIGRKLDSGRRVMELNEDGERIKQDEEMAMLVRLGKKIRDAWDGYDGIKYSPKRNRYMRSSNKRKESTEG